MRYRLAVDYQSKKTGEFSFTWHEELWSEENKEGSTTADGNPVQP